LKKSFHERSSGARPVRAYVSGKTVRAVFTHSTIHLPQHTRLIKLFGTSFFFTEKQSTSTIMSGATQDDWNSMCEHWRALALEHYQPLSKAQCDKIVDETLQAIKDYKLPEGTKQTDAFGWRDSVILDDDQRYVHFTTRKTLDADMEQVVDHAWSLYRDGDLFKKAHLGDNCEFFLQVLQTFSPDTIIIQRVEKYPDLVQLTHSLALCFRMKTETGYLIVFRCIESPQLQSQLKSEGLSLSGNFFWDTFAAANQGERNGIQFTMAGSLGSEYPTYAKQWQNEILNSLLRYETQYLDTPTGGNTDVPNGVTKPTVVEGVTP
jgi:hypothetical protein